MPELEILAIGEVIVGKALAVGLVIAGKDQADARLGHQIELILNLICLYIDLSAELCLLWHC